MLPPIRPWTSRRRAAFTLLEVILALSISLVLLGGLYITLDWQFTSSQIGREGLQEGTLARGLLTRISTDVVGHLAAVDPKLLPEASSTTPASDSSQSSSSESSTTSSSTTSSTQSGTSESSTSDSTTATTPMSSVEEGGTVRFNVGVYGQAQLLVLSVSRPQRKLGWSNVAGATEEQATISDLRRITYWVVTEGSKTGLARLETTAVTGSEIDDVNPQVSDPGKYVIAPEVKSLSFQYFDGVDWLDSWDGNGVGIDGETPVGPPSAIAINLKLGRVVRDGGQEIERFTEYRHVIALPAGNNFSQSAP